MRHEKCVKIDVGNRRNEMRQIADDQVGPLRQVVESLSSEDGANGNPAEPGLVDE